MDNSTNGSVIEGPSNMQYSSSHNIWYGIFGFIANSLSVILVLFCKCLRTHQKISILSLVFNDLVFMASLTIYGLLPVVGQMNVVRKLCWFLVYFTLATHTVAYMSISHITFISYLAVFKPLQFRDLTGTARTLTTVVCIWIASWLFVLICIRFDLPVNEKGCSLYLLVSGVGWITWVTVPILCAGLVTVVNMKILFYLKNSGNVRKSRVAPRVTPSNCGIPALCGLGDEPRREVSLPGHSPLIMHVRPSSSNQPNLSEHLSNTASPYHGREGGSDNPLHANESRKLSCHSAFAQKKEIAEAAGLELLHVPTTPARNRNDKENNLSETRSNIRAIIDSSNCASRNANLGSTLTNLRVGQSNRRISKATITLVLLTLSSCLLSLPEVIFCLVLAVQPEGRTDIANSNVAKFCKLSAGINALMNPAVYCWRLINWSNLRSYVVSKWRAMV
ncbi:hypothetical protein RRG08_029939 [Elysia crispata]|uniref:G-protein coupled receptors family 1 profile domain-containing protein n=1 Tax=Elysia crispata TaxID=231223 RepID=A0AAE0ZIY0_9GAST|nr:hypothetical protein RRG08_029939 [Elysia crispata]